MANYISKKRSEMFFEWLYRADPDDRHRVADHWNWDEGEDALRWIIQQPDCDKATALLVFWRGSPEWYYNSGAKNRDDIVRMKANGKYFDLDTYDMLVEIISRWKSGSYRRSELSWSAIEASGPQSLADSANHPALSISDDMLAPLSGRELDWGDFEEGIPRFICDATRGE